MRIIRFIHFLLHFCGINVRTFITNFKGLGWFTRDYYRLKKQLNPGSGFPLVVLPILHDKHDKMGTGLGHYFHQDLIIARKIHENKPAKHVDIGSRLDGFVAHVAAFRNIEVFDIRPMDSQHERIKFTQCDFMNDRMPDYTDSISCLHVIEHFGLGRYNDPIDVDGHLKGLDSIYITLKKGGRFYFSTPIGPQAIHFNAHRVFSIPYLLDLFRDKYQIADFSYVDDAGYLHEHVPVNTETASKSFNCRFGCGIFELIKI